MIEKLIKKIAQRLDKEQIPYMIIGGQAVLLYGTPRLTRDIDITLGVDTDRFLLLERVCRDLGLKILPENPEDFARETKVLPAEEPKLRIRVDFIFSFTRYEAQAIERAKKVLMNDYPVKFASIVISICTFVIYIVTSMTSFDLLKRSAAVRAMEHVGQIVLQYRRQYGYVPAESYLDEKL